jgi:hypothetical protein
MVQNTEGSSELLKQQVFRVLGLIFVLLVMTILLLRGIGNINLGYPDADRLLMDGVFIHDFLEDLPLTNIYQYTIEYYAQYPALSIGYRPPFFPFVEGVFNSLFGVNIWSSRLALLAFAITGISCWFDLLRRSYDTNIAISASLLLVTTPFFATWGWYTMSELPVLSMMMITCYFFFRYTKNENSVFLYAAVFAFCLSVWTKQTAVFQIIWFVFYILYKGRLLDYLKRKEIWISIVIILVLLIPLMTITLWLGNQNLEQSIGSPGNGLSSVSRLSWWNFSSLFKNLINIQITKPVFLLSMVGFGMALYNRDHQFVFFGLLIVSTYIFFTGILIKDPRYTMYWMPAFTLLAVLPLYYLKKIKAFKRFGWAIVITILIYQINKTYEKQLDYATGYDSAAQYVLQNCGESPAVLFDGYNNGYFTYFMRALDQKRSMIVLRGDKLLSSSSIFSNHRLEIHAFSQKDIKNIIDEFGISCIVIESRETSNIEIHRIFREYLSSGPFQLVNEIIVDSNRVHLKNQSLKIYRYLQLKPPTADYLIINLPVVGQILKIPYRRPKIHP